MTAATRPPVVVVTWVDSVYRRDAAPAHRVEAPPELEAVGFLVADCREYVAVALEWEPAEHLYRSVITIPRSAVTSVKRVRVK